MAGFDYPSIDGVILDWNGSSRNATFKRRLASGDLRVVTTQAMIAQFWIMLASVPPPSPVPPERRVHFPSFSYKSHRMVGLTAVLGELESSLAPQALVDPDDVRLRLLTKFEWPGLRTNPPKRLVHPTPARAVEVKGRFQMKELDVDEFVGLTLLAGSNDGVSPVQLYREMWRSEPGGRYREQLRNWVKGVNKKITAAGATQKVGLHGNIIRREPLDGFVPTLQLGEVQIDEQALIVRVGTEQGRLGTHTPAMLRLLSERPAQAVGREQLRAALGMHVTDRTLMEVIGRLTRDVEEHMPGWIFGFSGEGISLEHIHVSFGDVQLVGRSLWLLDMDAPDVDPIDETMLTPQEARLFALLADRQNPIISTDPSTYSSFTTSRHNLEYYVGGLRQRLETLGSSTTIQSGPAARQRLVMNDSFGKKSDPTSLSGNGVNRMITTPNGTTRYALPHYRLISAVANAPFGIDSDDLIEYVWGPHMLTAPRREGLLRHTIEKSNELLVAAGSNSLVGSLNGYLTIVPAGQSSDLSWQQAIRRRPALPETPESGMVVSDRDRITVAGMEISDPAERRALLTLVCSKRPFVPSASVARAVGQGAENILARWAMGGLRNAHLQLNTREGAGGVEVALNVGARVPVQLPAAAGIPTFAADSSVRQHSRLERLRHDLARVATSGGMRSFQERAASLARFTMLAEGWLNGEPPSRALIGASPPMWTATLLLLAHRPLYLPRDRSDREAALAGYTVDVALRLHAARQQLTSMKDSMVVPPQQGDIVNPVAPPLMLVEAEHSIADVLTEILDDYERAATLEIGAWWTRGERICDARWQRDRVPLNSESVETFQAIGRELMTSFLNRHRDLNNPVPPSVVADVLDSFDVGRVPIVFGNSR